MDSSTIGIDATNIRRGGGRTHLIELLRAANPSQQKFSRVVVWGSQSTLALLDDRDWLLKRIPVAQEKGFLSRMLWQWFSLSQEAREEGCDVLFIPGGSYAGSFHPVVGMSQNLLPFEWCELKRYGFTLLTLKLLALRITQSLTFKHSDGLIFLTDYAKQGVEKVTGSLRAQKTVITHGLNPRFLIPDEKVLARKSPKAGEVIRLIYVSIIDQYKHQWHVVEAIAKAREQSGLDLQLDLIGPAYAPALAHMNKSIAEYDPRGKWVHYHGAIDYNELHSFYAEAHVGIFASSCENMPNILLETMAAGLPVLSSNRGPMPEILGDAGLYFDPEKPDTLVEALLQLLASDDAIHRLALAAHEKAKRYSWERCAFETFGFLREIASEHPKKAQIHFKS
jgi:glycosyltransferase involved in cell wall biosynthesis